MSVLSMITGAAALLNVPSPQLVIGNTDPQISQLYGLLVEECDELLSKNDWPALVTAGTITVAVGALPFAQALPSDFDRFVLGSDIWNVGRREPLKGPLAANEWQRLVALDVGTYPQYWRPFGGSLNIWGAGTGDVFSYEYISSSHVRSSAGSVLAAFANDTDTTVLPEKLIKLALLWRWKRAKGFDYAEEMETYERQLERAQSAARGVRTLSTAAFDDSRDTNYWAGTIIPNA